MVVTVVVFNFALALALLYLAWRVRQLRRRIARVANVLTVCEQRTYAALHNVPDAINIGKQGIQQLRRGREPIQLQIQQVRQVLILLGIGQRVWRRNFW